MRDLVKQGFDLVDGLKQQTSAEDILTIKKF
jgi:hypothetical protein